MLNPKYSGLTILELLAAKEAVESQIVELTPVREQLEILENDDWEISQAIAQARLVTGEANIDDLGKVLFGASGSQELHNSLAGWLSEVSTSQNLVLTSLEDGAFGSSDFFSAPFTILKDGDSLIFDEDLISSVEEVADLAVRAESSHNRGQVGFHVGFDARLFLMVSNKAGRNKPVELVAQVSDYSHISSSTGPEMSVREAFTRLPSIAKELESKRQKQQRDNEILWRARRAHRDAEVKAAAKADKKSARKVNPKKGFFGKQ